jgi:hypothetical protein
VSRPRSIALLDVVEVARERADTAVLKGARGTVVDTEGDRYWVEFVGADGDVVALAQYEARDLRVVWSADSRPTMAREE